MKRRRRDQQASLLFGAAVAVAVQGAAVAAARSRRMQHGCPDVVTLTSGTLDSPSCSIHASCKVLRTVDECYANHVLNASSLGIESIDGLPSATTQV